jgi:acyl carrier protein
MNALNKKDDITLQLIEFLSTQLSIPKKKIHLEDSLFHDFGVDGDDAIEVINEYSKRFDVSIANFNIDEYFGAEISSSPIQMIVELFTKANLKNTPRFTVENLINGVTRGRLE